jgi:hypothetical protein
MHKYYSRIKNNHKNLISCAQKFDSASCCHGYMFLFCGQQYTVTKCNHVCISLATLLFSTLPEGCFLHQTHAPLDPRLLFFLIGLFFLLWHIHLDWYFVG